MTYWAVAMTHPQAEKKAEKNLAAQGFEFYAPKTAVKKIVSGRKVTLIQYLFPRYLFVRVVDEWYRIMSTIGISRIVLGTESQPSRLPPKVIDSLRRKEVHGLVVLPKKPRFQVGDRIRVKSGILEGHWGVYQGMSSRQREVILLDVLGRVELAATEL